MKKFHLLIVALLLLNLGKAQDTTSVNQAQDKLDSLLNSLHYQTGKILIGDNIAQVQTPEGFSFLDPKDARFVLKDIWNNPDDEKVLGMLIPKDVKVTDSNGWAVIYSYMESGHVKDDDAEGIKYDDLLEEMKKQTIVESAERTKMGYSGFELVGWAKQPFYDKETHKLHWAKEFKFDKRTENTLNYNIRMLGRKGVLVMNVVSGIKGLPVVEANIDKIMGSTNFTEGNTYNDFNSTTDKIAEYGIGGLIAGGVLLKTGLLAKLGLILIKLWKLIAVAVAGAIAFIRKKFLSNKKKNENTEVVKVKEDEPAEKI
ncbi:MAG TPA: DUF2167 domain-containing protein [Bacteroidia bacterium]|jgi:uncharacterized membrane-anchored protein|nr:DUF2167 domain-containing protein [Bacteroidia bacterium]